MQHRSRYTATLDFREVIVARHAPTRPAGRQVAFAIVFTADGRIGADPRKASADVPRPHPACDAFRGREGFLIRIWMRCCRVSCADLLRNREGAGVDNLVPCLARPAAVLADRRVRPKAKPVERLDVAAVRADLSGAPRCQPGQLDERRQLAQRIRIVATAQKISANCDGDSPKPWMKTGEDPAR